MTNLEVLMSKDEDKIAELLDANGLYPEGVCETDNCPYKDKCFDYEGYSCPLSNTDMIKIWLGMESKS